MGKDGSLIWITGLAGCGKTTLANNIINELNSDGVFPILIDGDKVREISGKDLGYNMEDRLKNAYRISRLCHFLASQGFIVICSTVSLFHEIHEYNRIHNKNYYEIFLDVDNSILLNRNKNNLYNGQIKEVVGMDQTPELPKNPALVLKNNEAHQMSYNTKKIIDLLKNRSNTKEDWDYSKMAKYYSYRPNYSERAISKLCNDIGTNNHDYIIADVGAGTGNLTILLKDKASKIIAIEPNEEMRSIGIERTIRFRNINWCIGTGENTTLQDNSVDAVMFGSSFNTTNREEALKESHRILKNNGFFVCMWNNRDLTTSSQKKVEMIIKKYYPNYSHGVRRQQQADIIIESKLFNHLYYFEQPEKVMMNVEDYINGWKSVKNQFWDLNSEEGRETFAKIIKDIENGFKGVKELELVYITKIWVAKKEQKKSDCNCQNS